MPGDTYQEVVLQELPSLSDGEVCIVIDVRTQFEHQLCDKVLDGVIRIPLHDDELMERDGFLSEVCSHIRALHDHPGDPAIAFICRNGNRSRRACELMITSTPYARIFNVKGGLEQEGMP